MGKKTEQSQKVYNKMAWKYDSAPEGRYTSPHKEEIIKKAVLKEGRQYFGRCLREWASAWRTF